MELSAPFSDLSRLLERLERSGVDVRGVSTPRRDLVADGVLAVTVEAELSLADALDAPWATVSVDDGEVETDGRLTAGISVEASLFPDDLAVGTSGVETTVSGGVLSVALPVEIPVDGTADPESADAAPELDAGPAEAGRTAETDDAEPGKFGSGGDDDGGSGVADRGGPGTGDPGVPVFRDHDRLQAAYERCDTFAGMREALGVDVTAETVRRYMIDAGIHEPDTYKTGAGADAESSESDGDESTREASAAATDGPADPSAGAEPGGARVDDAPPEEVFYADGIGLPDGLTVESLIAAITESNTLHEVSHALDVERGRARDALAELNLLDLVVGRLAMEAEREVTREEVVERLREADTGA